MSTIAYEKNIRGEINHHTITWTVFDYENIKTKELYAKLSKELCADSDFLQLRFKLHFVDRHNAIEIYYLTPSTVCFKFKVTIRDNYNYKQKLVIKKTYHTVQGNKWQYTDKVPRKSLISKDLVLILEFFLINVNQEDQPKVTLNDDFEILLQNGNFSDLIMKSIDGKEYKVHKAILAGRSVVLKANFEHNTAECHNNIVESPFEAEVLAQVLSFIYSDKAPKVEIMPETLLAAADYYQLSTLKSLCEVKLHTKLTVENAIDTLQLAQLHSADTLKQLTLDFIKDGQAKQFMKSDAWAKLSSVELIKTIVEHIFYDAEENVDN